MNKGQDLKKTANMLTRTHRGLFFLLPIVAAVCWFGFNDRAGLAGAESISDRSNLEPSCLDSKTPPEDSSRADALSPEPMVVGSVTKKIYTNPAPGSISKKSRLYPDDSSKSYIERMADTSISLATRRKQLGQLARRGDDASAKILMAIGDQRLYLARDAVEALGTVFRPEVAKYLRAKLQDGDAQMVMAATRAYARNQGEDSVAILSDLLMDNHTRPDNHEIEVCTEAVRMLGWLGNPSAVPVLARELGRSLLPGWNLEYGSSVVAALGYLGGSDAERALSNYADILSSMIPSDPLARSYFIEKIAEARDASKGNIKHDLLGDAP